MRPSSSDLLLTQRRYDKNGTVKVCDFGLSQLFEKGQKIMDEKRPKGTPLYMAPEVWLGREFNEKADIYRCGYLIVSRLDALADLCC